MLVRLDRILGDLLLPALTGTVFRLDKPFDPVELRRSIEQLAAGRLTAPRST
jgi:hypothetical protein